MHSISFTHSSLIHMIFILQLPRNVLLNYKHKMRGAKAFLTIFSLPRCSRTKAAELLLSLTWLVSSDVGTPHMESNAHPLELSGPLVKHQGRDTIRFPLAPVGTNKTHFPSLKPTPSTSPFLSGWHNVYFQLCFLFIKSFQSQRQCLLTVSVLRKQHAGSSRERLGLFLWLENFETWKLLP